MGRFDNKVILVTGAGRGIGRAHAIYLAEQGAKVVVNDLGGDMSGSGAAASAADGTVADIRAAGGTAVADHHDAATESEAALATAINEFGRIDGLLNNAGIFQRREMAEIDDEHIQRNLKGHVLTALNMGRAAWPYMVAQGYGRIVNTSSSAIFGVGAIMYPVSKGAVFALTRAQAVEGGPLGITSNSLLPLGYSRMAETTANLGEVFKKHFHAEQISPIAAALLCDDVPCSGEAFSVGGGRAARVFLGTVPGLSGIETIDDFLTGFEQVMSMEAAAVPSTLTEEMAYSFGQLGLSMADSGVEFDVLGNNPDAT